MVLTYCDFYLTEVRDMKEAFEEMERFLDVNGVESKFTEVKIKEEEQKDGSKIKVFSVTLSEYNQVSFFPRGICFDVYEKDKKEYRTHPFLELDYEEASCTKKRSEMMEEYLNDLKRRGKKTICH